MPTEITDDALIAALILFKAADQKDYDLRLEQDRLNTRLQELAVHFEDGGYRRASSLELRRMMIERNIKILLVGDDVVTMSHGQIELFSGIYALDQPKGQDAKES